MSATKEVLKEIAHQLRALTITVAALEDNAGAKGFDYLRLRSQYEQKNKETFDRLEGLIAKIPDK